MLLEIVETVFQNSKKKTKNTQPFDFPCVNDYCASVQFTGRRHKGIAWKNNSGYHTFCSTCSQDFKLSREEFLEAKRRIKKTGTSPNEDEEEKAA